MDNIIDGRALAKLHQEKLEEKIKHLNRTIQIVSILVGEDPSSVLYCDIKQKKARSLGIGFELKKYPENAEWNAVVADMLKMNQEAKIDGIMVQLPLPDSFLGPHTQDEFIGYIDPKKDVDGLTGRGSLPQATARGVLSILDAEGIETRNKKAAVVGARGMVGKELVQKLRQRGAQVTEINRETLSPRLLLNQSDIIISAVGHPNLIQADDVKVGAVVIDVGDDVDFDEVQEKASKITPPRGGVGPMTVISLMENAVDLV